MTAEAKADISHDQNRIDPDCPPHRAVIFKYTGMELLVTLATYATS